MSTPSPIPFNRPSLAGRELVTLAEAAGSGRLAGDGPYTERCHRLLEELIGAKRVLLTTSCTHALEMAALLLDVGPGDEVILPSFTFVSVANAFVLRGAQPVFADIRPDTLNIDEARLEALITPRTKAIVPVHYAGIGCAMDEILSVGTRHGVAVVEDTAHGLLGRYRGRWLGTMGRLGTLSFHETKNFTCGEGGALILNDRELLERAEIIREKGTNRSRFFRGQVDKYTWVDVGSSYLASDLLAAFLYAQLEAREAIQERRRQIWTAYMTGLATWAGAHDVILPTVPRDCEPAYHLFYLLLPSWRLRRSLIDHLRAAQIGSAFHYLPLHLSDMGQRLGGKPGDCPVTEDLSDRLLRLPLYHSLTDADVDRVVETVVRWQ
jgi:dTDP-4-amino-4,6-dideoxygalactose transaminase